MVAPRWDLPEWPPEKVPAVWLQVEWPLLGGEVRQPSQQAGEVEEAEEVRQPVQGAGEPEQAGPTAQDVGQPSLEQQCSPNGHKLQVEVQGPFLLAAPVVLGDGRRPQALP